MTRPNTQELRDAAHKAVSQHTDALNYRQMAYGLFAKFYPEGKPPTQEYEREYRRFVAALKSAVAGKPPAGSGAKGAPKASERWQASKEGTA